MKTISLIGSTGSIGVQTLQVAGERGYAVAALAAGHNAGKLEEQILRFRPRVAALYDEAAGRALAEKLAPVCDTKILWGEEGVCRAAQEESADLVLNAAVGIAGLRPTVAAIRAGKTLALANKESLVCAGELVNALCREHGTKLIPVDSEHSAIFQCLQGSRAGEVERILLTASGGPFFGKKAAEIAEMGPKEALKHPSWSMGAKITVDSATMMNKGFEMIEAMHLFHVRPEQLQVVVHRESIVHSLVEFRDGSVLAQLSPPDMRLPIQYAVDYPERKDSRRARLDLFSVGKLSFYPPDDETFPAMDLCREVMARGGNLGAAVNGANEAAVAAFLRGEIPFGEIYPRVERAARAVPFIAQPTLEDIFETDRLARAAFA
ncbi:MAG: 1-deoxy-D-xylulose-5-phosphate reductoisomerase [Clostridia bacterium]|nr:1-deoxy-D-xylulose-5-phosphate reductoisomerase [Clostridia bacterium]MDD7672845.1 1-deoxy-D-xylulose-5-phosphate reductoisomerase [Clostridia bacterium]MDY2929165.1 1-deoxy-D-xylulose-5-phosphate reductoisomerase [Clostridiaceae bacterium]